MNPIFGFSVFILVLLTSLRGANASDWAFPIMKAVEKRDKFLQPLRDATKASKTEDILKLIPALVDLSTRERLSTFHNVDFTTVKRPKDSNALKLFKEIQDSYSKIPIRDLSRLMPFENEYLNIGFGAILSKFKEYYDKACLDQMVSSAKTGKTSKPINIKLPLEYMCSGIKKAKHDETYASITNVCEDFNTCVMKSNTTSQDVCTKDDKCDITKAIPHFGAMIWYKISDYLANVICGAYGDGIQAKAFAAIGQDLKHFEAYISMLGWDEFFDEAVNDGGFATLEKFMDIVEKRSSLTNYVLLACKDLKSDHICVVADILKQHTMLKKIKSGYLRSGPVRDLRRVGDYDIRELIKDDNEDMKHRETMAAFRATQVSINKLANDLSKYFGTLALFDEEIANADIGYIDGEITKYDQEAAKVSKRLQDDVGKLMANVQTVTTIQLISRVVALVATIAENANPFKVMFTGVNAGDIYDKTNEVAAATSDVATSAALIVAVKGLAEDVKTLTTKFADNRRQINSLKAIVQSIQKGAKSDIDKHLDLFIKQYNNFKPKAERSLLVANDVKWAAFVDRACDILQSAEDGGTEQPIGKGVAGGTLICERLQGTLAEFSALREDIYDFQFDMVDALARVVRGNIAKKLASNIKTKNKVKSVYNVVRGFFMQHYKLQSRIFLYCNVLEYKKHGKKVKECPETGFFDYGKVNELVSNKPKAEPEPRTVYIPTRPDYPGDMGYIDLQKLKEGKEVTFQLPRNRTWLMANNWITCGDVIAPIVSSIKVFLPLRDYTSKQQTNTETLLTAAVGSFVHYKKDVRYILPENRGVYSAKYEENFLRGHCDKYHLKDHPYSGCDHKIPRICDNSFQNNVPTLRPTILSTWKLSYTITSGARRVKWNAPNPATNLYILAKVIHEKIKDVSIKCTAKSRKRKSVVCCPDGQYLLRWKNVCAKCPKNSHSALKGYYCEKDKKF